MQTNLLGDIVDHNGADRLLEVAGDERLEAFLSCRVPQLKAIRLLVVLDVLRQEVDSDCGLDKVIGTWMASSKFPWMYFSMMEDLPTPQSPSNTTLNLVLPPAVVEDRFCITWLDSIINLFAHTDTPTITTTTLSWHPPGYLPWILELANLSRSCSLLSSST